MPESNIIMVEKEVCIVVVLFNPNEIHVVNMEELTSTCTVVAVDNSESEVTVRSVNYIPLHENKGIAAAQNVGIKYARENAFKYVLFLDQDSKVNGAFVRNLYDEYQKIKETDDKAGFIGPVCIDEASHQEYKNHTDKSVAFTKTSAVIASGSLVPIAVLEDVGLMDESLFIDLVDFEWCWRAGRKGYTGYITRNVKMYHSIGKEYHNWHGFILGLSAPVRYYYQYRNTLWLFRREYVPRKWKIKSIVRRLFDMLIVPFASSQGWQVLKNMFIGIKDGLFYKNVFKY